MRVRADDAYSTRHSEADRNRHLRSLITTPIDRWDGATYRRVVVIEGRATELAEADARLGVLARRFRGMKPPRFATVFEAIVNGFACQQLSLEVGLELLNRLAAKYVLLRGLGRLDTFPGDDVGARKRLAKGLSEKGVLGPRRTDSCLH